MTPASRNHFLLTMAGHHAYPDSVSLFIEWLGFGDPNWDGREVEGIFSGESGWVRDHVMDYDLHRAQGIPLPPRDVLCHLAHSRLLGEALGADRFVHGINQVLSPLLFYGSYPRLDPHYGPEAASHPLLCPEGCLLDITEVTSPGLYNMLTDSLIVSVEREARAGQDSTFGHLIPELEARMLQRVLARRRIYRARDARAGMPPHRVVRGYMGMARGLLHYLLATQPRR